MYRSFLHAYCTVIGQCVLLMCSNTWHGVRMMVGVGLTWHGVGMMVGIGLT